MSFCKRLDTHQSPMSLELLSKNRQIRTQTALQSLAISTPQTADKLDCHITR